MLYSFAYRPLKLAIYSMARAYISVCSHRNIKYINAYFPVLQDAVLAIIHNPQSSVEDLEKIFEMPKYILETNRTWTDRSDGGPGGCIPDSYPVDVARRLTNYIQQTFSECFVLYLGRKDFSHSRKIATAYKKLDPVQSSGWIEMVGSVASV